MKNYKIFDTIKDSSSVCMIGHIHPDADALSSMVVFREFLKKHFNIKRVDIFAECESLPENYMEILQNVSINKQPIKYKTAIIMDSPNLERLGKYKYLYESAKTKVVIDHHTTNKLSSDLKIVEKTSSTCEIVYNILKQYKYQISASALGKLYAGIITDTNNLSVGDFSEKTFKIISEFSKNIDTKSIYNHFLGNNSLKNMQLLSLAIQNIVNFNHGKIILTHISHDEAKKYKATFEDYTGIINRLATINTSCLICFIQSAGAEYYVSMRANKGYDVSKIAVSRNGGGHTGAAAFTSNLSLREIEEDVLKMFMNELNSKQIKTKKIF